MSEEIPVFSWNTKTKEFNVLRHKFDGVNSVEQFIEYLQNQDKEIERLNNIINEFDKFLFGELQTYGGGGTVQEYYDKLQELKGSDK